MFGFSIIDARGMVRDVVPQGGWGRAERVIAKAWKFATMRPLATDSPLATLLRGATAAVAYATAMVICIIIGRYGAQVTPIWIPSAILAWALLMSPRRDWPMLLGLTALAHLLGAYIVGDQVGVEIVYLAANLVSPLLLVVLMNRHGDQLVFEDRAEVVRFLVYGGLVAPSVSAVVAVAPSLMQGAFDANFAAIWFLADGLSFVVFLPIFRIVATNGWKKLLAPGLRARALTLLGALIVLHVVSIFATASIYRIFLIVLIPYLIYIAFDAGMTAARAAIALSSVLLLCVALFAPAPLDRNLDPQGYLLAMQVYALATVASVLPISVALDERRRLYEAASEALHEAQEAWGGLIAAEAQFRLIADNASELILRLRSDGEILFASPAWKALVQDPEGLNGSTLLSLAQSDERNRVADEIATLVGDGNFDHPRHWQLHLRNMNDVWQKYDVRATLITADEFVAVLRQVQE